MQPMLLSAFASLLLAPVDTGAVPAATSPSALRVVPAVVDLGERAPAERVPGRVFVVNTSTEPLALDKVVGNCGCMTVQGFEPTTLAPNEALEVAFEVRSPDEAGAEKSSTLSIVAAGAAPRKVPVRFDVVAGPKARVAPKATPAASTNGDIVALAELGSMRLAVGESTRGSAWLVNHGTTPLQVDDVKGSCGCTEIEGPKSFTLAPGEAHEVAFRIQAGKAPGDAKRKRLLFVTGGGVHEATFELTTVASPEPVAAAALPAAG